MCAGQNNFVTNNVKNSVILEYFQPSYCEEDILFAVVHPVLKGVGKFVFGDGSDDPQKAHS
jgi:hypothetical protein